MRRLEWRNSNYTWTAVDEQVKLLDAQVDVIVAERAQRRSRLGYQKHLIAQGRRDEALTDIERALSDFTKEEKAQIKDLKTQKKSLNEQKKGVRPAPEIEQEIIDAERMCKSFIYCGSPLYSSTKDLVEDVFSQIRKTPQSDVRFRRHTGEGSLAVRFTSGGEGGISKPDIFSCQDTRLRVEMVRDERQGTKRARAIVHFRVKSDPKGHPVWATFPMRYHRELPDDASVKLAKVVAFKRGTELKYELHVTFESSTFVAAARKPTGLSAGFDIGWRGASRVGYLAGSDYSSEELALPFSIAKRIEHAQSIRSKSDLIYNENLKLLLTWLGTSPELPEWFEKRLSGRDGNRSVHSWKSHSRLEALIRKWRDERFQGDEAIFSVMEHWAYTERHLYQWWSNEDIRARGHRKDFYLNLAKRLTLKFDTIYVEDLRGDQMAKSKVAGGTRCVVAPFEFRDVLKKAAEKWGSMIVKVPAPGTSRMCNDCGYDEPWEDKSELKHACGGCGVVFDRDLNAARNILRIGGDSRAAGDIEEVSIAA